MCLICRRVWPDIEVDDAKKAFADRGSLLQPSLLLAIWDPRLHLTEALERGLTRMVLINANGYTFINLEVQSRQTEAGGSYAYDYGDSIFSGIPSISLYCDTSSMNNAYQGPCDVNLQIQYISSDITVKSIKQSMDWLVSL